MSGFSNTGPYTGWGAYMDTQYTVGSPLSLATGVTTLLPNNKATAIETQLPPDIASLYTGGRIRSGLNDGIAITVDLIGRPSTATATALDIWFDIGGSIGEFYRTTHTFPKGNGVARHLVINIAPYTGATWVANGAAVYVLADAPLDIYAIRYVVQRTHKGR